MKKSLTEAQFQACVKSLDVGEKTLKIAYGVLVKGETQKVYVEQLGLSCGAVSQAVNRVWKAHKDNTKNIPSGFTMVSEVLPNHQAYIVQKWAEAAKKKKRGKE
ncbi:MAG: transcriptional regulator [Candidatus Latescibacteria bacterium]|nr:transcriptional regulator [Candidatus Latescibacterota bacterium]